MVENAGNKVRLNLFEIADCYPDGLNTPTLNIEMFRDLRSSIGDDLLFSDLVTVYFSSAEDLINSIHIAFAHQDASKLTIAGHSLKSTSASIGAIRLSQIGRYLEKSGKTGKITISADVLELLNSEYEEVIVAIRRCITEFMAE
jgi:HPt (histidine-containing phosphotransfer) domain-containing protein